MAGRTETLVVVSLDGLSTADLPAIRELPAFHWIMERGPWYREVRIIDIGPTLAALPGVELPAANGRVPEELLAPGGSA